jgi:hypothetical protein
MVYFRHLKVISLTRCAGTSRSQTKLLLKMPQLSIANAHLRIARPTDNIEALKPFYIDGLGFEILYEFKDHDGFDGLMLGHPSATYHLELTTKHDHTVGKAPTQDNLLVFYLPEGPPWRSAVEQMEKGGWNAVKPFNSYWETNGRTFEDPDGYRVVLQNADWVNAQVRERFLETTK